jgi:hypothetical protein
MTETHEQLVTIRFIERWPAHEPRENDPNYHFFREAKARLKKAGLLKCVVDSDYHEGPVELHHSVVEFAHINDVSVDRLNAAYGLHLTDEQFQEFVEGVPAVNEHGEQVNSLEPLCRLHHRGTEGIHSLPTPEWAVLRVAKPGRQIAMARSNTGVPVV